MKIEMHFLFRQIPFVFSFLFFLTSSVSVHAMGDDGVYLHTGLPVCLVSTDQYIPRFEYIPAELCIVHDGDTVLGPITTTIAGRGNSTWSYPKKPYKIKFPKKIALLGMPAGKTFSLLANYCDKSLMRTALGFTVGRVLQQPWVPDSRFVELVLNGTHLGTYQLTESVKVSDSRVQLGETGFMVEYDNHYYQAAYSFHTGVLDYPIAFKYPDENLDTAILEYVRRFFNEWEEALCARDYLENRRWADYIDMESFVKWYYQKNLLQMEECNRYYLKNDTTSQSRLCMGPLWDFEWCLGTGLYYDSIRPSPKHRMEDKLYFARIAKDSMFMAEVAKLHSIYRNTVRDSVLEMFDQLTAQLDYSQAENFKIWPILDKQVSIGAYPLGSWEAEVACDRQFFLNHLDYLDQQLSPYLPAHVSAHRNKQGEMNCIYTLSGHQIDQLYLHKGIYILKGKKILIR